MEIENKEEAKLESIRPQDNQSLKHPHPYLNIWTHEKEPQPQREFSPSHKNPLTSKKGRLLKLPHKGKILEVRTLSNSSKVT